MKIYDYSEAQQNFLAVLNTALEEDVIIVRNDGSKFRLVPIYEESEIKKSPLENIQGIEADVTMEDILEAIRDGRERTA